MRKKAFIMILILLLSVFPLRNSKVYAEAYNSEFGSQVTAEIKLFYNAFAECLSMNNAYSKDLSLNNFFSLFSDDGNVYVPSKYIRELKYFGKGAVGTVSQSIGGWGHGAIIEKDTNGGYANGSFFCGEGGTGPTSAFVSADDNYVVQNFVGFVNNNLNISGNGKNIKDGVLNNIDLACSIVDNDLGGVFASTADGSTCKGAYNGDMMRATKSLKNLKDVLQSKVFGTDTSSIPGGSFGSYTDIEKYYLYQRAFDEICISNTDPDEGGGLTKTVQSESGEWVTNHYSFTPKGDLESMDDEMYIYSYNDGQSWSKASCKKLSKYLTEGDSLAASFMEYKKRVDSGEIDPEVDIWQDPAKTTDEEYENCKDTLTLGWLICPILFGITRGADALDGWIEGFFE